MLERLQRLAIVLHPVRTSILLFGMACVGLMVLSLIENPWVRGDRWLIPAVVGLGWSLTLYSLLAMFRRVPPRATRTDGWRRRLSGALRRGGFWVLALAFLGLSLGLVILSYQLLRTWFMA